MMRLIAFLSRPPFRTESKRSLPLDSRSITSRLARDAGPGRARWYPAGHARSRLALEDVTASAETPPLRKTALHPRCRWRRPPESGRQPRLRTPDRAETQRLPKEGGRRLQGRAIVLGKTALPGLRPARHTRHNPRCGGSTRPGRRHKGLSRPAGSEAEAMRAVPVRLPAAGPPGAPATGGDARHRR